MYLSNNREQVVACKGIPQSLQPHGGLHLLPWPLHVCRGVPIQHGLLHKVHQLHCNHSLVKLPSIAVMSQRDLPSLHSTQHVAKLTNQWTKFERSSKWHVLLSHLSFGAYTSLQCWLQLMWSRCGDSKINTFSKHFLQDAWTSIPNETKDRMF